MPAPADIDPNAYADLTAAFLALGPKFSAVARRTGMSLYVVKRLWEHGSESAGLEPISHVFEREQGISRTQRGDLSQGGAPRVPLQDALQKSSIDAAYSEIDVLSAFRRNVGCALNISGAILAGLERIALRVAEHLAMEVCNPAYVSIEALLAPLEKVAKSTNLLASTTKAVFEMQRLLVGAPQQITEHRGLGSDAAGSQEKIQALGQMLQLLQRNNVIAAESMPATDDPDDPSHYDEEQSEARLLDASPERKTA